MTKYKIRYLPTFEEDLEEALDYITFNLQNPAAAKQLLKETEEAILERLSAPSAFEPYYSKKERPNPYYRIRIKNYIVYYVVIEEVMEMRRFIYSRRNIENLI
jgi:Plasmid stabilization system protein